MKHILLAFLTVMTLTACQADNPDKDFDNFYKGSTDQTTTTTTGNNEATETPSTSEKTESLNPSDTMTFKQTDLPKKGDDIVVMQTSKGTIKIRLFPELAPKTVENFKGLIAKKYYDGLIFHRVMSDFMIQGGDPTGTGMGGESLWGGKFNDEFSSKLKNIRGTLSMANAGPNTNGSQFFIVQAPATPWLDGVHTVFGQVFEGLDIVDAIAHAKTNSMDKPLEDIKMETVSVEKY